MKEYIELVAEGKDLTEEQAKATMEILLSGEASQAQIGAFLMGLRMKGETLDELTGFAGVLRDKADTISPKVSNYVDLVGTGGDCTYTFNVSTTSAFVVAAAGLPVAKHGNRSISSKIHEICRSGKKGNGCAYGVQYFRTSCQSFQSKKYGGRCL